MKYIVMDRIATISENKGNLTRISDHKYKDLKTVLSNDSIIEVKYPLGQQEKCVKQLTDLGFRLKEVVSNDATEKYHSIREIWARI